MTITLQSAVFTSETNWLLKNMIVRFQKYDKANLIKFLAVDIEKVQPIYFNDMDYKKAEHEDCLFLFLDADCKIMGILKGNSWSKSDYSKFEHYTHNSSWGSNWVKKSRKGLTEAATHILMITPKMRNYKPKRVISQKPRFKDSRNASAELQSRLYDFKLKKNNNISYEEVLLMSQELMVYAAQNLFNPELEVTLPRKMREFYSFCDDMHKLVGYLSELSRDYYRVYQNYKNHVAKKEQGVLSEGAWEYFIQWEMKDLDKYKTKIITINKMVKGE